jgi:membrane-associated protein
MSLVKQLFGYVLNLVDYFLHFDRYLEQAIRSFGGWTYLLLFGIVFCETGLVVTPFLPGDSLLFAAGAAAALFAGQSAASAGVSFGLEVWTLFGILCAAAFLGDTVNYWAGRKVGPAIFKKETRFIKKEYLERTHAFYERYGGKTIIMARFIPIIRTFAPFVAGIGEMGYGRFISFNAVGGVIWVAVCLFAGYFFGNLQVVKKNFSVVILAIIFISVLPAIVELLRARSRSASQKAQDGDPA